MTQKSLYLISIVLLLFLFELKAQNVTPVRDNKHTAWSAIQRKVEDTNNLFQTRIVLVVNKIQQIQDYAQKAHRLVNGVVKNVQMVNQIIKIEGEILNTVSKAIDLLNQPLATQEGSLDLAVIEKWKHIEVLLAIGGQKDNVFELFKNVLEDDVLVMDDKGRLNLIRKTYEDVLKMRIALRVEIRRINKQVLHYTRKRRELLKYKELFS